jgi:hypothetical protein
MTRLNQLIATEKSVKNQAVTALTAAYHLIQRPTLFSGLSRTYRPKDEEGETFPPEFSKPQAVVDAVVKDVCEPLERLLDLTLVKDKANCDARANVVVGNQTILQNVPVTYLLSLEKQLTGLHAFIGKLPELDPVRSWTYDENVGYQVSDQQETTRTKKIPRNHVKAEATDRHPAQVEVFYEDVVVGYWRTVHSSGAIGADRKKALLSRVEDLQRAVKYAREAANSYEVEDGSGAGAAILGHIFGG